MITIRLDKFLADMQVGTRSSVKEYIRKGRVTVNDVPTKRPEQKVNPDTDVVTLDGAPLEYVQFEYYMLNKPQGVLSAANDKKAVTVIDLIESKVRKDLFPVGRLDKDTEGLMLICNDGMLSHQLLSPGRHVDKTYLALVQGIVTAEHKQRFLEGLTINISKCSDEELDLFPAEEYHTLPSDLQILSKEEAVRYGKPFGSGQSCVKLTLQEGKFHQVKRMFLAIGMEVLSLKRLSMGTLVLEDTLAPGAYRSLTSTEIEQLKA